MEVTLKDLGNSRALILSKKIRDELHIGDKVNLEIVDDKIIISSLEKPRQGWGESFKKMHQNGDDNLICSDVLDDDEVLKW